MTWKLRRGRYYYYHSERVGGRVKARYVGGGPAGQIAADMVAQRQRDKQALSAALHDYRQQLPSILDAEEWSRLIVSAGLTLGCRFLLLRADSSDAGKSDSEAPLPTLTDVHWYCDRATKGDSKAIDRLGSLLSQESIWRMADDLSKGVIRSLILSKAGHDNLVVDATRKKIKRMRTNMLGGKPTRVECIAVEQILVAWLDRHCLECMRELAKAGTVSQINFLISKKKAADRRLMTAVDRLEEIRSTIVETAAADNDPLRSIRLRR